MFLALARRTAIFRREDAIRCVNAFGNQFRKRRLPAHCVASSVSLGHFPKFLNALRFCHEYPL